MLHKPQHGILGWAAARTRWQAWGVRLSHAPVEVALVFLNRVAGSPLTLPPAQLKEKYRMLDKKQVDTGTWYFLREDLA